MAYFVWSASFSILKRLSCFGHFPYWLKYSSFFPIYLNIWVPLWQCPAALIFCESTEIKWYGDDKENTEVVKTEHTHTIILFAPLHTFFNGTSVTSTKSSDAFSAFTGRKRHVWTVYNEFKDKYRHCNIAVVVGKKLPNDWSSTASHSHVRVHRVMHWKFIPSFCGMQDMYNEVRFIWWWGDDLMSKGLHKVNESQFGCVLKHT